MWVYFFRRKRTLIRINKEEVNMLLSKGFKFGSDIHKTYTRYPHYYATEGVKVLGALNKYRNSKIVK